MNTLQQAPTGGGERAPSSPFRRWSPDEVIGALRRYDETVGPPRYDAFRHPADGFPSRKVVERRFGTWRAALDAAGLQAGRPAWTRDRAIVALQAFSQQTGRPPLARDLGVATQTPSHSYLRGEFGSVRQARDAAGVGQPTPLEQDSEAAVDALQQAAEQLGQSPTERLYSGLGMVPSARLIRLQFGSWQQALTAAGLGPTRTRTG